MAGKYWFAKNPKGRLLAGEVSEVFGTIAAGGELTATITVAGAAVGDAVLSVSCAGALPADVFATASVTAADTVSYCFTNTNAAITADLGTHNVQVVVLPKAAVDSLIAGM
jgi:hypothetical protein